MSSPPACTRTTVATFPDEPPVWPVEEVELAVRSSLYFWDLRHCASLRCEALSLVVVCADLEGELISLLFLFGENLDDFVEALPPAEDVNPPIDSG